ncbi:3-oxoacid CoA-transferase subunit B [Sulfitobacter mediterraneus]|nr:3-oxoacid CoA-transferase subunit B [Sulfitobacter mediterraneus]MBM1558461.1 3-oxoacid CoA-transferase subunit B [Sulfitobacter mediterraneus]MBM1569941.1 3-oxoacid CoA-transferase subunit B [Sulfitobacter mediterraneus]MBM1573898.1 3-oxoacid CoA-transferase subunit B [Sulfitobacter mediterraneus]MBM1577686.1 3-oxoacid CoA-transferase subunit B [Sulfitobacter mediterraneus]MBM1581449.1 3-oxoacid CoA-transferase subunit B [Sulfitobacter mediterraneus]
MPLSDARTRMIARAAREIAPGMVVNLGIGMPTQVVNHLAADYPVCLHTENGMTGVGPVLPPEQADRNLIDAGGAYVSTVAGSAFFDSATSFAMVRSGRLDLTMLGAFEVAANGDLANWKIPGKFSPGVGGGVELAQKARRVVVLTTHMDRAGRSKLKAKCALPITAQACVARIFTDMAVIDVTPGGFALVELAQGVSPAEICAVTDAPLIIPQSPLPDF